MPSQQPLPTIRELLEAFRGGAQGDRDITADMRSGSLYNHWAGVGAIVFLREATRDRDIFRAIYFDFAEGDVLDQLIQARFNQNRVLLGSGVGYASLTRATAGAGAGTILNGTRIAVLPSGAGGPKYYQVADLNQGTQVAASALGAYVPITSVDVGRGVGFNSLQSPPMLMRVEDPLWDSTWQIQTLICADGTDRQQDSDYRGATRKTRADARTGYPLAITNACLAAGAFQVALFPSDFLATDPLFPGQEFIGSLTFNGYGDVGLNRCYVGDAGFSTSPALLKACKLALFSVSMGGSALQVLPMAPSSVSVNVTVSLWDDPSKFDTATMSQDVSAAIINYFATRKNAFAFQFSGIRGAIQRIIRNVQTVTIITSRTVAIAGASSINPGTGSPPANPIIITAPNHGMVSGQVVTIAGVLGNLAANGTWQVTVIDKRSFSIPVASTGTYTAGTGTFSSIGEPDLTQIFAASQLARYLVAPGNINVSFTQPATSITNATNTNPIVVTSPSHGLVSGQRVVVSGVQGNLAANTTFALPNWVATVRDQDTFSIPISGNGAYVANTGVVQALTS